MIVAAEASEAGADGNLEAGIQMTTVHLYVIRRGVAECGGLYRHWRTEVADGRNSSEYFFEWKVRNLTS